MASYTGNLNLKKPALDDDALITDINNNMDILDAAANGIQDALAIVANGNTHAAITSGQFVYVRNHSTLTEGLYVASSNIAANATLSSSNLTADSKGGLNSLSEQIATYNAKEQIDLSGIVTKVMATPTGAVVNFSGGSTVGTSLIGSVGVCFGTIKHNSSSRLDYCAIQPATGKISLGNIDPSNSNAVTIQKTFS